MYATCMRSKGVLGTMGREGEAAGTPLERAGQEKTENAGSQDFSPPLVSPRGAICFLHSCTSILYLLVCVLVSLLSLTLISLETDMHETGSRRGLR